jgi:TetR/AcrR family transcriptional regulator, cholesterol catabolism regulator
LPRTKKKSPAKRSRETEVIDAAVEIFYRRGYSGAAIQEVADMVGMLKGSLYYYIDSKEDLLFRICESVHEESLEILNEVQALDLSPLGKLRAYIERHVRWYLENTQTVGIFFRDWRFLTGDRLKQVAERRRGYDHTIRELIGTAQTAGEINGRLSTKYASFYVLSAVNSVPVWFQQDGPDSTQMIAETYADLTVATLTGTSTIPVASES